MHPLGWGAFCRLFPIRRRHGLDELLRHEGSVLQQAGHVVTEARARLIRRESAGQRGRPQQSGHQRRLVQAEVREESRRIQSGSRCSAIALLGDGAGRERERGPQGVRVDRRVVSARGLDQVGHRLRPDRRRRAPGRRKPSHLALALQFAPLPT